MTIQVLNPTYDDVASRFTPAPRLATLTELTVGVISNGKHGTRPFFDAMADELQSTYGVAHVERVVKPNYSAPAGDEILDGARQWHALIAGIGD